MNTTQFMEGQISGHILFDMNRDTIKISGSIKDNVRDKLLVFIAAAPPDYRASFTGSGLPFASPTQALENTSNKGTLKLDNNNSFEIEIDTPNSYYSGLGTVYIPPCIYFTYHNGYIEKKVTVQLSYGVPYRMLTYPMHPLPRQSPSFYDNQDLPIRTQEQILREAGYPVMNYMYKNFWGTKPPL